MKHLAISLVAFVWLSANPQSMPAHSNAPPTALQLPACSNVVAALQKQPWCGAVKAIPATVIDKGVLRYVPYCSFQSGDYELNVYGDPNNPAGVEIGAYRATATNAQARTQCRDFVASILRSEGQRTILRGLDLEKDSAEAWGSTIEITAPGDDDSYGGWWVSVYFTNMLDAARASEAEMASISAPKEASTASGSNRDDGSGWSSSEMSAARPSPPPQITVTNVVVFELQDGRKAKIVRANPAEATVIYSKGVVTVPYERLSESLQRQLGFNAFAATAYRDAQRQASDALAERQRLQAANAAEQQRVATLQRESDQRIKEEPPVPNDPVVLPPVTTVAAPASSGEWSTYVAPTYSSGRVYVKGYTKKDGTYVRPHSRRR